MKASLFTILLITLVISACGPSDAAIQKAIALTQAALPTPTSTPTAEEVYCANMTEVATEFQPFTQAITDWAAFLNSPVGGGNAGDWGSLISLTIGAGPLIGQGMKNSNDSNIRAGINKFITLSKNMADAGTVLQIRMSGVTPPQKLKLSHQKIMDCIEPAVTGASRIVNFFEQQQPMDFPSFEACSSLSVHVQEIRSTCR